MVYVFLSMLICQQQSLRQIQTHMDRTFLILISLPYGNTAAHHVFQVVKQLTFSYQCTFH